MTWRATVLTLFPEMFPGPLGVSLAGKALASGVWALEARDIRDSATDRHRSVDDTPAGGGPGMVLRADVLAAAIDTMRANEAVRFALLFCEQHNFAFYRARGWEPFEGEIWCEQPDGRIRFDLMAPFVFDIKRAPRQGRIDLCGLPW